MSKKMKAVSKVQYIKAGGKPVTTSACNNTCKDAYKDNSFKEFIKDYVKKNPGFEAEKTKQPMVDSPATVCDDNNDNLEKFIATFLSDSDLNRGASKKETVETAEKTTEDIVKPVEEPTSKSAVIQTNHSGNGNTRTNTGDDNKSLRYWQKQKEIADNHFSEAVSFQEIDAAISNLQYAESQINKLSSASSAEK